MLAEIVQVIEKAQLSIITVSVVLFWLYRIDLSGVYKGVHERKSKQLDLLIKSLDNHHLSDNVKFAIQENVEAQLFYKSHGIRADKPYRDALINFNKRYPNQARWFFLRRAYPFMSLGESGRVELKVGRKDVWINNVVTWFSIGVVFLGFISLLLFLFATVFKYLPAQLGFTMAGLGFAMIFVGMYIHWTTWGRHAAIKLSKLEI
ncbi:hypothetical protein J9102_004394 [Vibrio vulnificus]|uniref:hypothetical protein n=1 Tax=Vibrio TaxID=662 RepID=UPI001593522C|nr:hypothetical protein [Vibrio aestuarianus]EHI9275142.1 hypothetical protein [Vibrio vulnificus]NGZ19051.1 hypothetical protein [Vibrio aestuarianus]